MESLLERRAWTGFASEFAREVRKCLCRASGYHSPASFHKDDNYEPTAGRRVLASARRSIWRARAMPPPKAAPKLLNMRDFRALSGFPSQPKRATIHWPQTGGSIGLAYFRDARPFHAKMRHWWGKVSCLH